MEQGQTLYETGKKQWSITYEYEYYSSREHWIM